jgi:hypothetical protein
MCANKELLTDTARDEWGFDGYITYAINFLPSSQKLAVVGL